MLSNIYKGDFYVIFSDELFTKYFAKTFKKRSGSLLSLFGTQQRNHNVAIFCLRIHWATFIKIFHFAVKYFVLNTASSNMIWCPLVENQFPFSLSFTFFLFSSLSLSLLLSLSLYFSLTPPVSLFLSLSSLWKFRSQ